MSKAILVLDEMPKSCDMCPFSTVYESPDGLVECNNPLSEEYGCDVSDYEGVRPDGCPLRELPEKTDIQKAKTMTTMNWLEGWNACIDEITGETEEQE